MPNTVFIIPGQACLVWRWRSFFLPKFSPGSRLINSLFDDDDGNDDVDDEEDDEDDDDNDYVDDDDYGDDDEYS